MLDLALVLTCEHGGNRVPAPYAALFRGQKTLLGTHRGWDPGALDVARRLARGFQAPLIAATTTRLLVDLNRSSHNRAVFSTWSRALSAEAREALIGRIHRPHWERVRLALASAAESPAGKISKRDSRGRRAGSLVVHVAVHSFIPKLDGQIRDFEIGLLYDPAREAERRFARAWRAALREHDPSLRVRLNAPYRGTGDGLTTALRREHHRRHESSYLGIELEMNQSSLRTAAGRLAMAQAISRSLNVALSDFRLG
jgi:predicted N-formylglutamate amidohydrolase